MELYHFSSLFISCFKILKKILWNVHIRKCFDIFSGEILKLISVFTFLAHKDCCIKVSKSSFSFKSLDILSHLDTNLLLMSSAIFIILSFISFAALLVKVTANILAGSIFFHKIKYAIL